MQPVRNRSCLHFTIGVDYNHPLLAPKIRAPPYSIEERSNREVCAQLNISESNLWVMLHRARRQLRIELAGLA